MGYILNDQIHVFFPHPSRKTYEYWRINVQCIGGEENHNKHILIEGLTLTGSLRQKDIVVIIEKPEDDASCKLL